MQKKNVGTQLKRCVIILTFSGQTCHRRCLNRWGSETGTECTGGTCRPRTRRGRRRPTYPRRPSREGHRNLSNSHRLVHTTKSAFQRGVLKSLKQSQVSTHTQSRLRERGAEISQIVKGQCTHPKPPSREGHRNLSNSRRLVHIHKAAFQRVVQKSLKQSEIAKFLHLKSEVTPQLHDLKHEIYKVCVLKTRTLYYHCIPQQTISVLTEPGTWASIKYTFCKLIEQNKGSSTF